MRVESGQIEHSSSNRRAAVHWPAAVIQFLGQAATIMPEFRTGARIDSEQVVPRGRQEHDAVNQERCGLQTVRNSCLKAPHWNQVADVVAADSAERAEALVRVIP